MPRLVVVGRSTREHLEFYSPIAEGGGSSVEQGSGVTGP